MTYNKHLFPGLFFCLVSICLAILFLREPMYLQLFIGGLMGMGVININNFLLERKEKELNQTSA